MMTKKLIFLLLIFTCLVYWFYCVFIKETPQERIEYAYLALRCGESENAIKELEELLDNDSLHDEIALRLANIHLLDNRAPLDSVDGFKYLNMLIPKDDEATELAIRIYAGLPCKGHSYKDEQKAMELIRYCINHGQIVGSAYNTLGILEETAGDSASAFKHFELAAVNNNFRGCNNAAWFYRVPNSVIDCDIPKAIGLHEKALRLNPRDTLAPYQLFKIYRSNKYVPQDSDKMLMYFNIACENGSQKAISYAE